LAAAWADTTHLSERVVLWGGGGGGGVTKAGV